MKLSEFREKPVYPVVYMFVVMFCLTAVLVGLARSAAGRVEANERVLFERAVLLALGLDTADTSPAEIHAMFTGKVRPPIPESFGAYIYEEPAAPGAGSQSATGEVQGYALPFEGKGFWNTIKGIIGVRPDGRTVTGIAFYEQSETPGLGAEIVKPRFRDQFAGFVLDDGPAPLRLLPGGVDSKTNAIHAVTGATQTCTRLEKILNSAIKEWMGRRGVIQVPGGLR